MKELKFLFEIHQGEEILSSQTLIIDEILARINVADIPYDQTQNIIDYIDVELLYNKVSEPIKDKLEELFHNLQLRN